MTRNAIQMYMFQFYYDDANFSYGKKKNSKYVWLTRFSIDQGTYIVW